MPETLKARILSLLGEQGGLTDRELTDRLLGSRVGQQRVNQACRQLVAEGALLRTKLTGGRIQNVLTDASSSCATLAFEEPSAEPTTGFEALSENALKRTLVRWLEQGGWRVSVKMGQERGIYIDAHKGSERWIIEVKGVGSRDPMRVNYFLGVLGETLQRMSDPAARYSIALPDHKQFIGLWSRLPRLAKERTGITALFVDAQGRVRHVALDQE